MNDKNFQSEFNSSLQYLDRINYIITSCILALSENDYKAWYRGLLILNLELSPYMDNPKKEEIQAFKTKANKKGFQDLYIYHEALTTFANTKGLILKGKQDDFFTPEENW